MEGEGNGQMFPPPSKILRTPLAAGAAKATVSRALPHHKHLNVEADYSPYKGTLVYRAGIYVGF